MSTIQTNQESLCPLRHILNIFSGKWKLPIVCMLAAGKPLRYSSIKRKIGDITNVMLSQSLKELERDGIVHREQYNEVPPRVEYSLTDKGKEVVPVIQQAAQWAAKDMKQTVACGANCEQCFTTK